MPRDDRFDDDELEEKSPLGLEGDEEEEAEDVPEGVEEEGEF